MFVRGGVFAAVVMVGLGLAGCQNNDAGSQANFVGPDTNQLVVGYSHTCRDGGLPANGGLSLSGIGFNPGASVDLSWLVASTGLSGTWPSRAATASGDLTAKVQLPPSAFHPGDAVQVWVQGSGPDGITAMRGDATIGSC